MLSAPARIRRISSYVGQNPNTLLLLWEMTEKSCTFWCLRSLNHQMCEYFLLKKKKGLKQLFNYQNGLQLIYFQSTIWLILATLSKLNIFSLSVQMFKLSFLLVFFTVLAVYLVLSWCKSSVGLVLYWVYIMYFLYSVFSKNISYYIFKRRSRIRSHQTG